jgi:hypothetical protein
MLGADVGAAAGPGNSVSVRRLCSALLVKCDKNSWKSGEFGIMLLFYTLLYLLLAVTSFTD